MMISEIEHEELKNYMLNQGVGPLSVEFKNECKESVELERQASESQNDAALQKRIDDKKKIIGYLIEKYNVSLERLWDGNFPNIEFQDNTKSTTYTSIYPIVTVDDVLLTPFSAIFQPTHFREQSRLIFDLVSMDWVYVYHSESMITEGVKTLLTDVLVLLNLQKSVRIVLENTFDGKRSDLWMLKTASGAPFLPIKCIKPRSIVRDGGEEETPAVSIMDPKVLGQCYHYMQQLRSSFGQETVYGIITTLEEWRILYLPNDSYSSPRATSSTSSSIINIENKVCVSQVYSLNRKEDIQPLITAIANVIDLSYSSSYIPVPLISDQRGYIVFKEDKILWGTITGSVLKKKYIKFHIPNPGSQLEITVLRSFLGGADGNVYLGLTQNFDLVVVKKFTKKKHDASIPSAYDNERKYWPLITSKEVVSIGTKSNILVLPFAFPCLKDRDGRLYFDFNLNKWGSATENIIEDVRFTDLSLKFQDFYNKNPHITPEYALKSAVALFSKNKCVHDDIEWRHVALLPQVTARKGVVTVTGLTPIFIDLSRVHDVANVQIAKNKMLSRINQLYPRVHVCVCDIEDQTYEQKGETVEYKEEDDNIQIPSQRNSRKRKIK